MATSGTTHFVVSKRTDFIVLDARSDAWATAYYDLWHYTMSLSLHTPPWLPLPVVAPNLKPGANNSVSTWPLYGQKPVQVPPSCAEAPRHQEPLDQGCLPPYAISPDSQIVWTLASTGLIKTRVKNADLVDPDIHPVLQGRFGFHHLVGDDPNIFSSDDDRAPSTDTYHCASAS